MTAGRNDALIPFVFENLPVRGAIIQLRKEWRALLAGHDYSDELREILGHAAAATPCASWLGSSSPFLPEPAS